MKKLYYLFTLLTYSVFFGQTTDLIISEYGEGTTGNSKYIEIYNGTGASIDLTSYRIWTITNGGTWPEGTINLTGTLADNSTFVIANNATDVPGANLYTGSLSFNGDDAVGIAKDIATVWTLIDAIGTDGADPGTGWDVAGVTNATANNKLTRKPGICSPNTNWATSAGTDASSSEWIVGTYTTGSATNGHVNSCSSSISLTITSPANATVYAPNVTSVNVTLNVANFNVANGTGDGHIHYQVTKDATPQGVVMKYDTTPIALTGLTPGSYSVYVELVDNSHNPIAPAVNATVTFVISSYTVVADLAALRADVIANGAGKYYQVSSNPVITYARSSTYRNQKYVQDSSAGILIDDVPGTISTTMVSGDAISGLRGQTSLFSGVLQLLPIENATVATSGNTVTPQVVTIANITGNIEAYESELVQINTVSFVEAGGNFAAASNYTLDDTANTLAFRTNFAEANYIGSLIPAGTQNVVVLVGEFNGTAQVTARNVTDMPLGTNSFNAIDGLRMYPNPLTGNVLNFNTTANAELDIQIFDILGKQVLTSKVLNNSLNVTGLNAGIYIVKITEEGKTATRKLVVK